MASYYLSRWQFNREDASPLNELVGRTEVPEGVTIQCNYTIIDRAEGFTVFEADSHEQILHYTQQFRKWIPNFDIVPIESVASPIVMTK